jgi:hypothetical protein
MRYNAYIVELKHRENSLTESLMANGLTLSANFRKIDTDIFMVNFKTQVEFTFLEKVPLKKRNKEMLILLPVLSKYNKRKLIKISKFLNADTPAAREKNSLLLHLLSVEKFLRAQELLSFFQMDREPLLDFLIQSEVRKEIKIIDFTHLAITRYENVQNYFKEMEALFTDFYTDKTKTVKLTEIEAKIKLPQSSLLFKYLLQGFKDPFSFKITKDKIVFQNLILSDSEKGSVKEIEHLLKINKLNFFTIEILIKQSGLPQQEVNDSLWFLIEKGLVVRLNERFYILKEELDKILNKLKKYKRNQGEMIDIKSLRELIQLSRKYILPLFEYFDSQRITQRLDTQRKILIPT